MFASTLQMFFSFLCPDLSLQGFPEPRRTLTKQRASWKKLLCPIKLCSCEVQVIFSILREPTQPKHEWSILSLENRASIFR